MRTRLFAATFFFTALFCGSSLCASARPVADSIVVADVDTPAVATLDTTDMESRAPLTDKSKKDSIKQARREEREEIRRLERLEFKENLLEYEDIQKTADVIEAISDIDMKEAGVRVKKGVRNKKDSIVGGVKGQYKEKKQKAKREMEDNKELVSGWFKENVKANTVGEFQEVQRQKNHVFAVKAGTPWSEYSLQTLSVAAPVEAALFGSPTQDKPTNAADLPAIQIANRIQPVEVPVSPRPETYYEGAGSEVVAQLMSKQQYLDFKFYGENIRIHYFPALRNVSLGKGLEKNFHKFWEYLSEQDFYPVLFQLYQKKIELALPDYLYCQLVKTFADKLFEKSKKGENLGFTVFMLCQTGYDARLGRLTDAKGSRMTLLLPFLEPVYDAPSIEIDGKPFCMPLEKFTKKEMTTFTVCCYKHSFDSAAASFSLYLNPNQLKLKPIYGRFHSYIFNERLAEVEASLPAGPLAIYAEAPFGELLQKTLQFRFKPLLDSAVQKIQDADLRHTLSEREKQEIQVLKLIDFLENHLSLSAKNSSKLGGRTLYPDLMFMKKGSGDILDRSLLCAQIARRILGIESALIVYPGFAVPAMAFKEGEHWADGPFDKAETFVHDGKTYYLCGKRPANTSSQSAEIYIW